jgi:hypothetical protein
LQTFQVFGSTKLRVSTKHSNCGEKLGWPLILKTLWISFYVEVDLTAFLKVWKNGLRWEANCCCYTCLQLNPISNENLVKQILVLNGLLFDDHLTIRTILAFRVTTIRFTTFGLVVSAVVGVIRHLSFFASPSQSSLIFLNFDWYQNS